MVRGKNYHKGMIEQGYYIPRGYYIKNTNKINFPNNGIDRWSGRGKAFED